MVSAPLNSLPMSKTTNTVRVKATGESMVFSVESWSKPGEAHRVDLLAYSGFGECSCLNYQTRVRPFLKIGGEWHDPKASCRHIRAARRSFLKDLLTSLARAEEEP